MNRLDAPKPASANEGASLFAGKRAPLGAGDGCHPQNTSSRSFLAQRVLIGSRTGLSERWSRRIGSRLTHANSVSIAEPLMKVPVAGSKGCSPTRAVTAINYAKACSSQARQPGSLSG